MRRLPLPLVALVCGLAVAVTAAPSGPSTAEASASSPVFSAPSLITFDFVSVGSASTSKTLTVTNAGTAALKFKKLDLVGRDAADFRLTAEACTGASLAPSASCSVGVQFVPSTTGTRVASIRFSDNTPCRNWVTLGGSGENTPSVGIARASTCDTDVQAALDSTTTNTTTSTTTTTTTTGSGSTPISASSVVDLSKTCTSRRTVTVRLTAPSGKTFTSVKIMLRGKTLKTLKGKQIKTKISLAGLPRGRFTVRVRATTDDGKSFVRTHYYVTCVAKK